MNTTPPSEIKSGIPQSSTYPPKGGRGCFFYGCITLIVVVTLAIVAVYFVVKGFVTSVTDATPMALPAVHTTSEHAEELANRVEKFAVAFKDKQPGAELSIVGDEFNELLTVIPELKPLQNVARLTVRGDHLEGKVSLELSQFGFSGRYFNGEAAVRVMLQRGELVVNLLSLSSTGWSMPSEALKALSEKNLAEEAMKEPKNRDFIDRISTITISDGVLNIRTK